MAKHSAIESSKREVQGQIQQNVNVTMKKVISLQDDSRLRLKKALQQGWFSDMLPLSVDHAHLGELANIPSKSCGKNPVLSIPILILIPDCPTWGI